MELFILLFLSLYNLALAASSVNNHSAVSLDHLWGGELADLKTRFAPARNPELGGQKFGYCCRYAIRESLEIANGTVQYAPGQTHLTGTVGELFENPFPCDNSYSGSGPGFPLQVWIRYPWCSSHCPGWQMTIGNTAALRQWFQPLILFVVPAAVFCLSIPRARRLNISSRLFPRRISTLGTLLSLIFKIPAAALLVTLDMLLWTICSMTFAGPMILSATYEAILDRRLLNYLCNKMAANGLSVRQRAHLLLIVVFGTIECSTAWTKSVTLVDSLPADNLRRIMPPKAFPGSSPAYQKTPCSPSPSNMPPAEEQGAAATFSFGGKVQVPAPYSDCEKNGIQVIKSLLVTSLENQTGFGTAAGAPALFYCGNFAYTLIELSANYGDVTTAHHLAFAMTWTVIPHIALVCSMLLGCKNPFLWDAATATLQSSPTSPAPASTLGDPSGNTTPKGRALQAPSKRQGFFRTTIYPSSYESESRCAWVWDRGIQKRNWICRYAERYPLIRDSVHNSVLADSLWRFITLTVSPTVALIFVPVFLGAMISYTTPAVGLSCRSMTLLVYTCAQCSLIILWTVRMFRLTDTGSNVATQGAATASPQWRDFVGNLAWLLALLLNILFAFFSGIMGTVFVFTNLYNNCLCAFPAKYWLTRWTDPKAVIYLSSTSYEQIGNAKTYWTPVGIAGISLLVSMSWLGWWYSRHMKTQFKECVLAMDRVNKEEWDEDEMQDVVVTNAFTV
ncbi:hypothetical protein QBC39DRAFT_338076 [Podospora conica]|nr:hypothetical protein QBC39DRAFT_338076 [Schizothecium conicum]